MGSRPGSAHSAPMLDLSIDRHYEFDAARTPTDDLTKAENRPPKAELPPHWNRPYLGYNPRARDRELGSAAAAARAEQRVFSDSEIYSPVFPRGRPEPRVDVSARVEAMRKEFAEYQRQMSHPQSSKETIVAPATHAAAVASATTSTLTPAKQKIPTDQPLTTTQDDDRLESLI